MAAGSSLTNDQADLEAVRADVLAALLDVGILRGPSGLARNVDAVMEAVAPHLAVRPVAAQEETDALQHWQRVVADALGVGESHPGYSWGIQASVEQVVELIGQLQADASEWRDSQLWRNDCAAAGHPDDEDCYIHDPALRPVAAQERIARVEELADEWENGARPVHWRGFVADLRRALTGDATEPARAHEHVRRFGPDGKARCDCTADLRRDASPTEPATPDPARAASIADCPTPIYHQTHRYCPSCPWTERDDDA